MIKRTSIFALAAVLVSCSSGEKDYDATGTFEATEVTVSAEQNGRLLKFDAAEGTRIEAGREVGLIDTMQLHLKALQIGGVKQVYASQRPDTQKQVAATREQLRKAEQELERFSGLYADGAANRKAVDDARSQVEVLRKQLAAQESQLSVSTNSLAAQMSATDIERLQVEDQLRKCHVATPIGGTVLEKYAEQGEFVSVGKPLFKIADVQNMYLRAYVTTAQLRNIAIGKKVTIVPDYGTAADGTAQQEYAGMVSWISEKSEFTPKTILTDDERADLVYAVKIAVKNTDGRLKIGMYGRVKF